MGMRAESKRPRRVGGHWLNDIRELRGDRREGGCRLSIARTPSPRVASDRRRGLFAGRIEVLG